MSRYTLNDWRMGFGEVGFYGASIALAISLCFTVALQAAYRTWAVGRFVSGKAVFFVDGFLVLGVVSVFTLIASICGSGKKRLLGVAMSFAISVIVIWNFLS